MVTAFTHQKARKEKSVEIRGVFVRKGVISTLFGSLRVYLFLSILKLNM